MFLERSMLTQEADDPLATGEAQTSFYNQLENKRTISLDLRCGKTRGENKLPKHERNDGENQQETSKDE